MKLSVDIRRRAGTFYLDVAFSIEKPLTAIFGPSGSGKTTILNCITGVVEPGDGEVSIDGKPLYSSKDRINLPPEDRSIGYVFQEGLLFPHLTVEKNIFYGFRQEDEARCHIVPQAVIDVLEIQNLLGKRPSRLSGGEQQRVAIARALLSHPRLLIFDEPVSALDWGLKSRFLGYLRRIKEEFRVPILYVTHALSEIMNLADEVIVVKDGRVLVTGGVSSLFHYPDIFPMIESEGLENVLTLKVLSHNKERGVTELGLGRQRLVVPLGGPESGSRVSAIVRAQDIIVSRERPTGLSARNILKGVVEDVSVVGSKAVLFVDLGEHIIVEITLESLKELGIDTGETYFFIIKSNSIRVC
ncbi:MAG: molybdenum ABC transporter ATP-binding protein [Candidatus Brocadiales bacterium]